MPTNNQQPATSSPFPFFGTSHLAVHVLDTLLERGITPTLIITAPDRPAGRKLALTPPPVKQWAIARNIAILQPEKISRLASNNEITASGYQFAILASYGALIPHALINAFPKGIINIHPSLLPHYRGPSPVQSQILADKKTIGVSVMLLDEEVDHGPLLAQREITLEEDWPHEPQLEALLAEQDAHALADALAPYLSGTLAPRKQNHTDATFTNKITKSDGEIAETDIMKKPREVFLKIRAYDPWPGVYFFTERNGKHIRVVIKNAEYTNGTLLNIRVVPEGKKEINWEKFKKNKK